MTKGAELARKLKYQVVLKSLVVLGMPFNIDIFLWQIFKRETSSVASIAEYASTASKNKEEADADVSSGNKEKAKLVSFY